MLNSFLTVKVSHLSWGLTEPAPGSVGTVVPIELRISQESSKRPGGARFRFKAGGEIVVERLSREAGARSDCNLEFGL